MNMECQRRTSVFGATVSSLGQWKQRSDSKICTNMLGNPVLSVLCVEPIMEIWILIRSLSHWHLIHPFVGWYNLTSAWHFVWKILTNCFHESVNVPAFYQNYSWEQIMWAGQRWHWRLWRGLRLTTFNFSFHQRPLQGSLTQPNCDKDQLYSRPGLWFNTNVTSDGPLLAKDDLSSRKKKSADKDINPQIWITPAALGLLYRGVRVPPSGHTLYWNCAADYVIRYSAESTLQWFATFIIPKTQLGKCLQSDIIQLKDKTERKKNTLQ